MRGKLFMFSLIVLCSHIGLVWTQYYNYDEYHADYVDAHGCGWTEHFCSSTDRCNNGSEPCDGHCGGSYHFCPSNDSCLNSSEPCDGECAYPYYLKSSNDTCIQCKENDEHFCSSTDMCINASKSCDGQCGGLYHFCPSIGSCLHNFEACDGQCGLHYHFCPSNNSCIQLSEPCDGQCLRSYHFCPSTDSCIYMATPCDGNCPEDRPNLCDNGTYCYSTQSINDHSYTCADRSDEHRPTEEASPLDNFSLDKFLQLNTAEGEFGDPGLDCQDGTMCAYWLWCVDKYSRMCGGLSTTDYFVCHNSTIWKDRSCGDGYVRRCKVPGKCIYGDGMVNGKCNGQVGKTYECGASDYSDEVCPVNKDKLKEHTRYFRCKDNSSLIHPTLVCDGFKHCNDFSDENDCDICPRVNNTEVHGQMVQLKVEEMRDLPHLKSTAIMRGVVVEYIST